jgi:hypothetical protein
MPCAARYQETSSFEFILNPFKFFFTNYVKKSRHTEHRQASLEDAVSVTYNLRPLATIKARINAAFPANCGAHCRAHYGAHCALNCASDCVMTAPLHATYLKLRLRARWRAASASIICSGAAMSLPATPFDATAAASSFPAPSQTHPVCAVWRHTLRRTVSMRCGSQCCLPLSSAFTRFQHSLP